MKAKKGETAADFSERLRVEIVRLRLQHTPHILGQSA
jgi:hypothetical protein